MSELSFDKFSKINRARSYAVGQDTDTKFDLTYMAVALSGEVGELCNFVKKQIRDKVDHRDSIMKEICDIQTYLDLLAEQVGCTVEDCLKLKWNEISARHGLPYLLEDAMLDVVVTESPLLERVPVKYTQEAIDLDKEEREYRKATLAKGGK